MELLILTGMSGAGKSTALNVLEDMGFFCVDNLPVMLIDKFMELLSVDTQRYRKVAMCVDIRSGNSLQELQKKIEAPAVAADMHMEILFLDASDEVLVKRYKETRRSHPLAGNDRLETGITKERSAIAFLKDRANYIIDTSQLLTRELKSELENIFIQEKEYDNLYVTILSFGFKYGIPTDSDLVFDVRFLPNPYYIEQLRKKTGNDKEIQDFVMQSDQANPFLDKLEDMLRFLIPNYVKEGKNQLVISVGCTGGKHRSVTMANAIFDRLNQHRTYGLRVEHRDIEKDAKRGK